ARGILYEQGRTDFADVLEFRARRTTLGGGGIGVSMVGQPFEHAGTVESVLSIDLGEGPMRFVDRARSWGVGASLSRLAETVARMSGREAPWFTHFADLALG